MNRRALLTAVPALAMAGAVPAMASGPETPIMQTYREIMRLRDTIDATSGGLDEEYDRLASDMFDLADRIVDMPCQSTTDFVYKLMGHTINGDHDTGECPRRADLWSEARALIS